MKHTSAAEPRANQQLRVEAVSTGPERCKAPGEEVDVDPASCDAPDDGAASVRDAALLPLRSATHRPRPVAPRGEPLVKSSEAKQASVSQAYSRMSEHLRQGGFRSTVFYMTAKHLADFELIDRIQIAGKRILNIGCCEPLDELFWCRRDVREWVATDINPDIVAVADHIFRSEAPPEHQHKVRFEVADARSLPYADGEFDAAVSLHAIDHVPDRSDRLQFVREMARVIRPGGHVVLLSTNRYGSFLREHRRLLKLPGGPPYGYAYFFTPGELRRMLRQAGLMPTYFTSEHKLTDPYARRWKQWLNRALVYFGNRIGYLAVKP